MKEIRSLCLVCDHEKCPTCHECHNNECEEFMTPFNACFDLLLKNNMKNNNEDQDIKDHSNALVGIAVGIMIVTCAVIYWVVSLLEAVMYGV